MRLTHHGHACVLIDAGDGGRILVDPGNLSAGLDEVGRPDAVLVTHEHVDHLDLDRLRGLRAGTVYADPGSAAVLDRAEQPCRTVGGASPTVFHAAGVRVEAVTVRHEVIHPDLPVPVNNAYLIDDRILHPGDALWRPGREIDLLLLPIGAPWLKLAEAVDYVRDVRPRRVLPIHQGGLAEPHRRLHRDLIGKLAPAGTELITLAPGAALTV